MSQWITPSISQPAPRNLTQELNAIYAADARYAPQSAGLNTQYSPVYNRTNISNLAESALGYTDAQGQHIPGTAELNRTANSAQRQQDIADVMRLGPAQREAYLNANPELRYSLEQLMGREADSPLLRTLNTQAGAALQSGGQLSAQDLRDLTQQSRAAFADRGLLGGNASIGAELLARDAAVRGRIAAAQQFAAGVQGLNQGQNEFVGRATGVAAGALSDPYASILSRPGGAGATQNNQNIYGPQNLLGYGQDLYNTNFNQQAAHGIATAQNQAQTRQAIASIAGSFISDERLKTNIKYTGKKSPDGHKIYEWEYKTDPKRKRYRGVMAQEVEKFDPFAVLTDPVSGLKAVDYKRLDVEMEEAA